jgi:hypothetical protein
MSIGPGIFVLEFLPIDGLKGCDVEYEVVVIAITAIYKTLVLQLPFYTGQLIFF